MTKHETAVIDSLLAGIPLIFLGDILDGAIKDLANSDTLPEEHAIAQDIVMTISKYLLEITPDL